MWVAQGAAKAHSGFVATSPHSKTVRPTQPIQLTSFKAAAATELFLLSRNFGTILADLGPGGERIQGIGFGLSGFGCPDPDINIYLIFFFYSREKEKEEEK